MNNNLLFDYSVDKENKSIHVKREFDASLELVWQAWTSAEWLDRWFGPKSYRAETITMDFREGGYWLYNMISAEGDKQCGKTDYHKIVNLKYFTASDSFCDEDQNLISDYPISLWTIEFTENADITTINVITKYEKLEDLEKMMEWGYMDGFTSVLQNLDQLFSAIKKEKNEL